MKRDFIIILLFISSVIIMLLLFIHRKIEGIKNNKNKANTPLNFDIASGRSDFFDLHNNLILNQRNGNPNSRHSIGRQARERLESVKASLQTICNAQGYKVLLTSGATESNSLALLGYIRRVKESYNKKIAPNIIISSFEHPSIRGILFRAKEEGVEVRIVHPNKQGVIKPQDVESLVDENTLLVSITLANGEIGTIQPLRSLVRNVKKKNKDTVFHSDMTQCPYVMHIDLLRSGVDMATLDGSKVGAPVGIGVLFVRKGINISPLFLTTDTHSSRPGTPQVFLGEIMVKALEAAQNKEYLQKRVTFMTRFQEELVERLQSIPHCVVNGLESERLPHIVSASFKDVNHEYLRSLLDSDGVCVSTGSACTSGDEFVTSVKVLNNSYSSAIRFSFDEHITQRDISYGVELIKSYIKKGLI